MAFLLAGYSGAPFSTGLQPAAADRMGEIGVGKSRLTVVAQSGNDPPYPTGRDSPDIQELSGVPELLIADMSIAHFDTDFPVTKPC